MNNAEDQNQRVDVRWIFIASIVTASLAFSALVASQYRNEAGAVGVVMVIFFASFTAGALIGFIFGVPRILTRDQPRLNGASMVLGTNEEGRILRSNTNLEKISDWLTTMLVGVGLSQLNNIGAALSSFSQYIDNTARVFDGSNGSHAGVLPAVAPPFLIAGACVGFLLMYLHTRTTLSVAIKLAEEQLHRQGSRISEEG